MHGRATAATVRAASPPSTGLPDPADAPPALPHPARRVISLAPHLTELAYAAGAGDRLVGVTRYSDHPAAARALPQVGDAFALNLEAIAQLRPDLILAWRSALPPRQRERLRALGIPVWETEVDSVERLAEVLAGIGTLTGTSQAAQARAQALLARWQALQRTHAGQPALRVFYQVWDAPLMTLSGRHLIGQAIRACGGVNPFADLPVLTPTVSWEAAVRADPELIVAAGEPAEAGHALQALQSAWARYAQVAAVRRGQIRTLQADLITRMGPRFLDGAQALCDAVEAARQARERQP